MKKRTIKKGKVEDELLENQRSQNFITGSDESLFLSLAIRDSAIQSEKFDFIEAQLHSFHNLKSLEIVSSQLDTFTPKRLSRFLE